MIGKKSSRTGFAGSMVSLATIITMTCMVSIIYTTAIKPAHPGKGITPAPMPATVIIDGNSALDGFCGGNGTNGTLGNPHIIENITFIMDDDIKDLLVIRNTNLHLIIRNCTFLGNSTFTGTNLLIENVSNTIVQNCSFIHGVDQLELSHVNDTSVTTCSFENGTSGIKLSHVDSCKVNASRFTNGDYFMYLESMVTNLTIGDNNASNALDFFHVDEPDLEHLSAYQVNNNNSVNGRPLYYLVNETDMNVAGDTWAVYIFNSNNITVLDQDWEARLSFITFNSTGITFTNSTVNDTEVHFHLFNATNVMVSNVLFSNVSGNIDLDRIEGLEIDAVNLTSTSPSLLSFSVDNSTNISCSDWKTADSRSTSTVSINNSSNISIVDSIFPNDTITHQFINCTDINLANLTFLNWSVSAFLLNECHNITFSNNILNESADSPWTAFIMINCDGTVVKNSRCMDYEGMCFGIQGNDLNASKNTTFANITFDNCSKAIDAGNSGDIVVENVSVNNSQFAMNFHGCSNVHISNSSMDSSFSFSIFMSYCNNTYINDGYFRNNSGFAGSIYMYEANGFELNNCSFLPNPQKRHHGVLLLYSSGGDVNGNMFNHSYDSSIGIYIQHSTKINVEGNTFNNYSVGINVYESTKVNVTSNNFTSMQETGVLLEQSSNVIISLNELQGNEGISGVTLTSSWFNSLQSNSIENFYHGIYLWDAISNDIQDMAIQACNHGVYIYNSRQNIITASNFTNFDEYGILIEQSRDNNITWCSFSQSSNCIHEDKDSKDNHFSNNTNCDFSGNPSPRKNPFIVVGITGILIGALFVGLIIYQKITVKKKKELARKYKDVPSNRKVILKLDRIRKEYTMGKETIHALKDASLEVERGDFIAIMGPSGSGKSTLLNIIGTLDAPTSGMLYLNGKSIFTNEMVAREKKGGNYKRGKSLKLAKEVELAKLRRMQIGFVFQFYNLIPVLSALENVMLPMTIQPISRDEKREKALNLLELVGLKGMGDRLPSQLSGGEQQRVSIARALANDPVIVLADEPTGNLDQGTGREIMKLFEKLNSENAQTFLIVTHDPAVASRAHKIIHISDGSIEH